MTGALDAKIGPLAVKLISKFGKTITLIRVTEGTYDVSTGTTTNTEVSSSIVGIIEDYKPFELANGLAVIGDKKVTVAASNLTMPSVTDKLIIDSIGYSIVSVGAEYSGALAALYYLQARKA